MRKPTQLFPRLTAGIATAAERFRPRDSPAFTEIRRLLKRKIYLIIGLPLFLAYIGIMAQVLPMGAFTPPSPGGSSSVGSAYAIDIADGAGSWTDSGCNVVPNSTGVNCPAITYSSTRTVTNGTYTCPLFPDKFFTNVNASAWPIDPASSIYLTTYEPTSSVVTAATWTGGTATITLSSSSSCWRE